MGKSIIMAQVTTITKLQLWISINYLLTNRKRSSYSVCEIKESRTKRDKGKKERNTMFWDDQYITAQALKKNPFL